MSPLPDVPNSWADRHHPVLHSIVARFEATGDAHSVQIADDTDLDQQTVERTMRELREMGWINAHFSSEAAYVTGISETARTTIGAWPSPESLADRLIAAVERGLAAATTDDERSRWRKLRDGLTAAGPAVLINATGSALGNTITGG